MRLKVRCELTRDGYTRSWFVDNKPVNVETEAIYRPMYSVCRVKDSIGYGVFNSKDDTFMAYGQSKIIQWAPFPTHATASEVMDMLAQRIAQVHAWVDTLHGMFTECEREF